MAELTWDSATLVIALYVIYKMSPNLTDSRDYLKSIDKKMHTHAADGSLVGIGGWY